MIYDNQSESDIWRRRGVPRKRNRRFVSSRLVSSRLGNAEPDDGWMTRVDDARAGKDGDDDDDGDGGVDAREIEREL